MQNELNHQPELKGALRCFSEQKASTHKLTKKRYTYIISLNSKLIMCKCKHSEFKYMYKSPPQKTEYYLEFRTLVEPHDQMQIYACYML